MTAKAIRESFKNFFAQKGHKIVASAPMVIKDDPTLMFTNAGMNQFKDIILGNTEPMSRRVANAQKCLRVSGKHNDLEEVGRDTYHHTMFEMLGNWSFGDYFKEEAISWAWEYLVEVLKLNPERLYATVFEGSAKDGLGRDDEAAAIWGRYLPADRVLNGNKHDNFWEMGDTGPCGPCSEIHIDIRSDEERRMIDGRDLVNHDHPQVIEIWNLVFMQYSRLADASLVPLPHKVIDTGMGFERLCMALQGKTSNYDTDAFQPIIRALGDLTGHVYGCDEKVDIAMRVVSDHVRTIAFSITDGQLPSNAKAGYVIRRILRRAVRYGYTFLNRREPFIYTLIPVLIETMGDAYPELQMQRTLIERVIKEEEDSFLRTLETGIRLLEKKIEDCRTAGSQTLSGVDTFTLYDTFGFPFDLTELILREHGMRADEAGFNAEMQKQKERARSAAAVEAGDWIELRPGTETKFVGYDQTEAETNILRYRQVKQKNKEYYQVVLSVSPFYAEMGGQVGDSGALIDPHTGSSYAVEDTKRENSLPMHLMPQLPSDPMIPFVARISRSRRQMAEANHTATHLLHEALRDILGEHVEQKGSFVSPEVLRFDFSHFAKLSAEEIRQVECRVTERIRDDLHREEFRHMPIAEARDMGAIALFGEKYGDEVRVLKYGSSVELCGGTHVASTGMIGTFRIVAESSIAAGVRRIEAVTGVNAENHLYGQQDLLRELHSLLGDNPNIVKGLQKVLEESDRLKKQLADMQRLQADSLKNTVLQEGYECSGIHVYTLRAEQLSGDIAKDVAFGIRSQIKERFVFVAGTEDGGKPALALMIADDLVAQGLNASTLIRAAARHIQGGGGGQPQFATAGGKNPGGLDAAIRAILTEIEGLLAQ